MNGKKFYTTRQVDNPLTPFNSELVNIHLKTDDKLYGRRSDGSDFLIGGAGGESSIEIPTLDISLGEGSSMEGFQRGIMYSWKDTKDTNKFLDYSPEIWMYRFRDKKKSIVIDDYNGGAKVGVYKKVGYVKSQDGEWISNFPFNDKPSYEFKRKLPTDWAIYEIPFRNHDIVTPFQVGEICETDTGEQFTVLKVYTFGIDNSAGYLVTDWSGLHLPEQNFDGLTSGAHGQIRYKQSQYTGRHNLIDYDYIASEHFREYTEIRFPAGSRTVQAVPNEILVGQSSGTELQVKQYRANKVLADGSLTVLGVFTSGTEFWNGEEIIGDVMPSSFLANTDSKQSQKFIPRGRKSRTANGHYFVFRVVCTDPITNKKYIGEESRPVNIYNGQDFQGWAPEYPLYRLKGKLA